MGHAQGQPAIKGGHGRFHQELTGKGTTFGNTMFQRYLKNTKWIKNSTSQAEMKKFKAYVKYFQQYATEYNFDYVMLAAQGYQESGLTPDLVSPRGAVGIMQVLPQYAAAAPISIPNVRDAENNIHAGAKMLAQITKTYFNDPGIRSGGQDAVHVCRIQRRPEPDCSLAQTCASRRARSE